MKFNSLNIAGAYTIELVPFEDNRGNFARTFCKKTFESIVPGGIEFVQINHSVTHKEGVIRGMHYQIQPYTEDKLIRCINGVVYDVLIDLRKNSPTFLHWESIELSKVNRKMIFIPKGCAHGFQTLSEDAELIYHHSAFYTPEGDRGIRYNDPTINIKWPLVPTTVSEKDRNHPFINEKFTGIEI